MNSIALLAEIIAQGGSPSASFYRKNAAFALLVRDGFLNEAGVIASVMCDDCEDAHAAQVVFEDGRYGYNCPDLGFLPLDQAEISAIRPNLPHLVACMANAFNCTKRKLSTIHGQTWRIGSAKAETDDVMLYFHPRLQTEEDTRDLEQALNREVRSPWRLIVSASGTPHMSGAQVVHLSDLFEMVPDSGVLRVLARADDLVGMPRKNKGGRPSEYKAALSAIITDRVMSRKAFAGLNAETRAVLEEFRALNPAIRPPSHATIKRHLQAARAGS